MTVIVLFTKRYFVVYIPGASWQRRLRGISGEAGRPDRSVSLCQPRHVVLVPTPAARVGPGQHEGEVRRRVMVHPDYQYALIASLLACSHDIDQSFFLTPQRGVRRTRFLDRWLAS